MSRSRCSCVFCGKELATLGLSGHIRMTHLGQNNFQLAGNAARSNTPSWNKGKTLSTNHRQKISASLVGQGMTEEAKNKLRKTQAKNQRMGGFREGGGRGKKGRYKGIWCDSSWELAYLIWAFDHCISIQRFSEIRLYEFDGTIFKYHPDFLVDGQVVEVKGWKSPRWEAKIFQHPDIVVIGPKEIPPFIAYAESKFGIDFVRVYE
jgi:hypothetical protein